MKSSQNHASKKETSTEVVVVDGVSKTFPLGKAKLISALGRSHRKENASNNFQALENISFSMQSGEAVGILGENGSGKSTLLQIIAGTLKPSCGSVKTLGHVAALLELGSGFDPEFTGRENVFLNASILGFAKEKTQDCFDSIEAFADIGQFIDQPVRTYSSGMRMRLAFAIQVHLQPDILIVDEALAVGDDFFKKRCYKKLHQLVSSGTTFLFVTHNEEILRQLTSRVLLLNEGRLIKDTTPQDAVDAYKCLKGEKRRNAFSRRKNNQAKLNPSKKSHSLDITMNSINKVTVLDENSNEEAIFGLNDKIMIKVEGTFEKGLSFPSVGLRIRNKEGLKVYSWATANQDRYYKSKDSSLKLFTEEARSAHSFCVIFSFYCHLGHNLYTIESFITNEDAKLNNSNQILDWVSESAFFRINIKDESLFFGGIADLGMQAQWELNK